MHIIRNARIENVGKSQSCMVSKLRIICKQIVSRAYLSVRIVQSLTQPSAPVEHACNDHMYAQLVSACNFDVCDLTGACGYNRPCAHQYVGKSQSCMVQNGRLIPHASYLLILTEQVALIEGSLAPKDVPQRWSEAMQESFGLTPPSDTLGCLQDIHWSSGMLGTN